jgi:hypothetical protein
MDEEFPPMTASIFQAQAFQALGFLMEKDLGSHANDLVLRAVELTTRSGDSTWEREHVRSLQLTLIELSEDLSVCLTQYAPFRRDGRTNQNGVFVMILRIARRLADGDKSQSAVLFCRYWDDLLAVNGKKAADYIDGHTLRRGVINKSTGEVVSWC